MENKGDGWLLGDEQSADWIHRLKLHCDAVARQPQPQYYHPLLPLTLTASLAFECNWVPIAMLGAGVIPSLGCTVWFNQQFFNPVLVVTRLPVHFRGSTKCRPRRGAGAAEYFPRKLLSVQ
jgi:hypothetical protein